MLDFQYRAAFFEIVYSLSMAGVNLRRGREKHCHSPQRLAIAPLGLYLKGKVNLYIQWDHSKISPNLSTLASKFSKFSWGSIPTDLPRFQRGLLCPL